MASVTNYAAVGAVADWTNADTQLAIIGAGVDAQIARIPQLYGSIFYVDAVNGSDENDGLSAATALATLAAAVDLCTANVGDVIVLRPGHVETLTASLAIDVAGVTIWGVGNGSKMPQFKMNNAAAEISVAADNVRIHGVRFSADVTSVAVCIEIEDGVDYCEVDHCVFDVVTTGTDEFTVTIRTNDASNFAYIHDNYIDMGIAAAVAAISFTKDTDGTIVRGNYIQGDYSAAEINGITTLSTKLLIEKNLLMNGAAGDVGTLPAIVLLTGSTGVIRDNDIVGNYATLAGAITADTCMMFRNYTTEAVTETGTILGTANADD